MHGEGEREREKERERERERAHARRRESPRESALAPPFMCFFLHLGLPYAGWTWPGVLFVLFVLPGNLQWKLVNSLHATTHLGEKALQGLLVSRECMFLSSLSRHNKDLERQTLKPWARHSSWVLDKLWYSS